MSEEALAAEFLGRPKPRRRRPGLVVGGLGLAVFMAAAMATVFLPAAGLLPAVAAMAVGAALLAGGWLLLRR